jgi:hypothetical protein
MLGEWTTVRDLSAIPDQSFREWWALRQKGKQS